MRVAPPQATKMSLRTPDPLYTHRYVKVAMRLLWQYTSTVCMIQFARAFFFENGQCMLQFFSGPLGGGGGGISPLNNIKFCLFFGYFSHFLSPQKQKQFLPPPPPPPPPPKKKTASLEKTLRSVFLSRMLHNIFEHNIDYVILSGVLFCCMPSCNCFA